MMILDEKLKLSGSFDVPGEFWMMSGALTIYIAIVVYCVPTIIKRSIAGHSYFVLLIVKPFSIRCVLSLSLIPQPIKIPPEWLFLAAVN